MFTVFAGPLPDHAVADLRGFLAAHRPDLAPLDLQHVRSSMAHVYRLTRADEPDGPAAGVIVRALPGERAAEEGRSVRLAALLNERVPDLTVGPLSPRVHDVPLTEGGALAITCWPELGQVAHDHHLAVQFGVALRRLHQVEARSLADVPVRPRWHILDSLNQRLATLPQPLRDQARTVADALVDLSVEHSAVPEGIAVHGFCHGDFKASNFVVAADGTVRMIDWDTAHHGDRGTEATKWANGVLRGVGCQECLQAALDGWFHGRATPGGGRREFDQVLRSPAVALRAWNAGRFAHWLTTWPPPHWDVTPFIDVALVATEYWHPSPAGP